MSSELRELYQDVILDHNRHPRNFRELADATHTSEGDNPLCGDTVKIYISVEDDLIKDIAFEGSGCAISKASASMLTDSLKGKSIAEAEKLFTLFQAMVTSDSQEAFPDDSRLGKLVIFAGVREFPVRVKCATLSWHTMKAALDVRGNKVSTE